MDDSRDSPGTAGSTRTPLAAAGSRLSPVQEAWQAYVSHMRQCDTCRAVDGTACEDSLTLHRAWRHLAHDSMKKVWRS